jgi:hypothetical protein
VTSKPPLVTGDFTATTAQAAAAVSMEIILNGQLNLTPNDFVLSKPALSLNVGSNTRMLPAQGSEVNRGPTLNSSYAGTGKPVNTLAVTASNTTPGETVTTLAQTIDVTDPPLSPDRNSVLNAAEAAYDAFWSNSTLGYGGDGRNSSELSPSDGSHSANLSLLSQYMASTFVTDIQDHGGTRIADPAGTAQTELAHPHA